MKIGVAYPQIDGGVDVGAVRAYAQGVEAMGYDYIMVSDHVISVELTEDNDWDGGDARPVFREPFVFCAFMAGATSKIEFSTAVTVISQRQTVLMAKQIADLNDFSGGRFRFGIGTGWCEPEYEALGAKFKPRGRMMEEQIELLRDLWTKPKVTISTEFHTVNGVGLYPLPKHSTPIWIGGADAHSPNREKLLRRVARMADGWIPHLQPTDEHREHVERFRGYCREYGRDPAKLGIEAFIMLSRNNEDAWADQLKTWREFGGITHVGLSTVTDNLLGVDANLKMLEDFRKVIG